MKKILPYIAASVFTLSSLVPSLVFAGTIGQGGGCSTTSECQNGLTCGQSSGVCELNVGSTNGGGSGGGLNTTRLQAYADSIVGFINGVLVPLLTAIAFIVFLWGVYNFFIWGADNEEKRAEGKTFIMYGVIGFVVIFSIWGLVGLGVEVFGLGGNRLQNGLNFPTL